MNPEPALLIIAPIKNGFDLAHFPWSGAARERISINGAKFNELDLLEVIMDGMPFLLCRLTAVEAEQKLSENIFEKPFADIKLSHQSAIGVTPREILTSGQHLPEINHRILLLGKWIGDGLAATAVAWMPSGKLVSFEHFDEAVEEYLSGRPLPSPFQTASSEA